MGESGERSAAFGVPVKPMVASAVHRGCEAQADAVHAALDELERQVLAPATRGVRAVGRGVVVLSGGPAPRETGDPRGEQERTAGAHERVADGLDGRSLSRGRDSWIREVVLVRQMDDGLGSLGAAADAVQVVQVSAADPGALGLQGRGGRFRPGQSGDLVTADERIRTPWTCGKRSFCCSGTTVSGGRSCRRWTGAGLPARAPCAGCGRARR